MSSKPAIVAPKGARRWAQGHPWIYKSDVQTRPSSEAGVVQVHDQRGKPLGWALWSPRSEISLRLLDTDPNTTIDGAWWSRKIAKAVQHRSSLKNLTNACRLVHGEADGMPSLVVDKYDKWLVVQLMSAGVDSFKTQITDALLEHTGAEGILARNDAALREKEGLPRETVLLHGDVPQEIEVIEHGIRYMAAPWTGQKTGAFLDQRENRVLCGSIAKGRALDCFSYHGSFALHLAHNAEHVIAIDVSGAALERAEMNAQLNGITNIEFKETDAFDYLTIQQKQGSSFDTIVLDPPAFAKNRGALHSAIRGYKDINMRAMRLLAPGGLLYTASCSFHLTKPLFLEMLQDAAADSGRRIALRTITGQPLDHPEILTIPETGYIKGAVLEALD